MSSVARHVNCCLMKLTTTRVHWNLFYQGEALGLHGIIKCVAFLVVFDGCSVMPFKLSYAPQCHDCAS